MRIELQDVTHTYEQGERPVPALRGVSLTIVGPQFISIVGPSAAGKSTLLHLIGGLDVATTGKTIVDGVDLGTLKDDELAGYRRTRVGFVFQSFHLLPRLTAVENVAVPCLLDGVRPSQARERAHAALADVGLAAVAGRGIGQLSGGQAQRVAIARAMVLRPPLVLADEPTGNLDSSTGQEIVAQLRAVTDAGTTVIVVTHNEQLAAEGDRLIGLADGQVVTDRVRVAAS
jgi:ABC-type lipoprotein export system ATPase subunit